ncbi:MAG: NlpC/P60 family protein [Balneolia bacterium]|nr:NlpC/P60 family protein [Balneolia bacterium]
MSSVIRSNGESDPGILTENGINHDKEDEHRLRSIRNDIIDYAHTFMGVPYRWGGTSPRGFDCSGYIWYVFKEFGLELPRVSRYQQREATPIKIENLRPGDLIFFSNGLNVNHAGIVISNTGDELEMIHASTSIGISVVDVLSSSYWEPRIHSGGRYLDVYDFIEENPQLAEQAQHSESKDIMDVPEVQDYARQVERDRRNRMRIATAFRAGTTGLGGELITDVSRGIHIRLGYSGIVLNNQLSGGMLNLHGSNRYSTGTLSLLANFHITERFYLTAGGAYARASSRFDYDTSSQSNFRWLTIDESQFDDLRVNHEMSSDFYPYFGVGFGRAMSRTSLIYLSAEIGVMYHGGLNSTLSSDSLDPELLSQQQQLLSDGTSGAGILPVINFQVSFRIF